MVLTFLSPLIIIPRGDTIKVVLDAKHLNSNCDHFFESCFIDSLAPQLARANKKYKFLISCMLMHMPV